MAIDWARVGRTAVRVGRRYGPTVAREVRRRLDDRGVSPALSPEVGGGGRPATTGTAPTSSRARRIAYAPDLDGHADPGEIVWTWVPFEEDHRRGKDRPVLVVDRAGDHLLCLMLTSRDRSNGLEQDPDYVDVGTGPWDPRGRPSEVKLDRVVQVLPADVRREGAVLPEPLFDRVAGRLHRLRG